MMITGRQKSTKNKGLVINKTQLEYRCVTKTDLNKTKRKKGEKRNIRTTMTTTTALKGSKERKYSSKSTIKSPLKQQQRESAEGKQPNKEQNCILFTSAIKTRIRIKRKQIN